MNKPDCGNHRTGQPRCAQLIANIWNDPLHAPHQHAVSTACRLSASRKDFETWPNASRLLETYSRARAAPGKVRVRAPTRDRGEKKSHDRDRQRGCYQAVEQDSHLMKNPRRENVFSFDIVMLLMLHVLRVWIGCPGLWARRETSQATTSVIPDRTWASQARFRASREPLVRDGQR